MRNRLLILAAVAATACVGLVASAAGAGAGQLYQFSGTLLATPGSGSTSLSVQVETGNRPALRALVGYAQNQTFQVDAKTEFLVWAKGLPTVASVTDLHAGDWVTVKIRAPHGSSITQIEGQAARIVADRANAPTAAKPLWLFVGTVAGPQSGGKIALHVTSGNWKALQAMLGQALDQSFAYDDGTIFLLWQGRVPTVIDASKLKAGDKITVRIRAPRTATLAQVEATPAKHVGDHEPPPPAED